MKTLPIVTKKVQTRSRNEMIDVTDQISQVVSHAGISDGMVIIYVPHTTAAITINENADPDVKHDMLRKLETLIPKHEGYYRHSEGNSDSHVKAALVGSSVTVLIERRKLMLGRWQGIYFCEFDGPRNRDLLIKGVSFDPA